MLHTAAYWLMLTMRDAIPSLQRLATTEFAALRLLLLKIAGRITETATRVRVAFAPANPRAELLPVSHEACNPPGRDDRCCGPLSTPSHQQPERIPFRSRDDFH